MTGTRSLVVRTAGPEETRAVGRALGRTLRGRVTLSLEGPLGSGKTVLASGVCDAVGVEGPVTSPTFTLQNEYEGREGRRVVHMDCFRLGGAEEFEDLGVEDRLAEDAILLVEWGDRVAAALPPETIRIELETVDAEERRIRIRVPPSADLEELDSLLQAPEGDPGR